MGAHPAAGTVRRPGSGDLLSYGPAATSAPACVTSIPAQPMVPYKGSGVWDLAVRLQFRVLAAWAVTAMLFGVVIGSLAGNVGQFLTSPNSQDLMKKLGGAQALTDAFMAAEIAIMGILAAAYGLSAVNHLRSEETAGHTETLRGTATTRALGHQPLWRRTGRGGPVDVVDRAVGRCRCRSCPA